MFEVLWPTICAGCGERGAGIVCPRCRPGQLHRVDTPIEGVAGIRTTSAYSGRVGKALRVAKYGARRPVAVALAGPFGRTMATAFAGTGVTAIVPAPTSRSRLVRRGFSASALLARALSRELGVPVVHALTLDAGGLKQAALSSRGRRANLAGRVRAVEDVGGRVLLVDDVVTTGATAEACARELLGAGAGEVWLATLCAARDPDGRTSDTSRGVKTL